MTYILNLFGTGIRFWICEIPTPLFEEMNKIRCQHKVEWEDILFDLGFLEHVGFSHWSELSSRPEQIGFLLESTNRVEIKQGAKFLARFKASELREDVTLFPLFQTNFEKLELSESNEFKTVVLVQYEKGLITKFSYHADYFSIDHLTFGIRCIQDQVFLGDIIHTSASLNHVSDDTLVLGTKVILL